MPKYKTSYSARWMRLSRISSVLFDTSVLSCSGRNSPFLRNFSRLSLTDSSRSIRLRRASLSSHLPFTFALSYRPPRPHLPSPLIAFLIRLIRSLGRHCFARLRRYYRQLCLHYRQAPRSSRINLTPSLTVFR